MSKPAEIARVAYKADRAYRGTLRDPGRQRLPWAEAEPWQRAAATYGVEFLTQNAAAGPADIHADWLAARRADGWTYGPEWDGDLKTHPLYLPYVELPADRRATYEIFFAVVRSLTEPKKARK